MPRGCYVLLGLIVLWSCTPPERLPPRFRADPRELISFRLPDIGPRRPSPVLREYVEPVNRRQADSLRTPAGYTRTRLLQLADGLLFKQYERQGKAPPSPVQSLRALLLAPAEFRRFQPLFSDSYRRPLYFHTVAQRRQTLAVLNWGFFGSIPAGDILGQRCHALGKVCQAGLYHQSEQRTRKRTDLRYTLAINRQGKAVIFRGGLGKNSARWYSRAVGGGILLFDREQALPLWLAVGRKNYNSYYVQGRYNESSIVRTGQAGDPSRRAPRCAMGIMADGSLLLLHWGEGRYRLTGGATPAQLALALKQMGAVRALLFDGGGAPVMAVRTRGGRPITNTLPEHTRTSNYYYNYSFLALTH
jgi:hypothetical protein